MQDDRGGRSENEDRMNEKTVRVLYDPARRGRGPLLTVTLPCTPPETPYRPDLPTDIRLYLRVVGDARVHIGDARPTRIACYDM